MALTKERKILITIAGVACGLVVLDQALLGGGPASVQAAGPRVTAAAPAPAIPPTAATGLTDPAGVTEATGLTAPSTPPTSLAQRLAQASRHLPQDTPNAFRVPAAWTTPEPADGFAPEAEDFDPRAFANRHALEAVFASPQGAYAMINGQTVRLGETREGAQLADIGDRWVIWNRDGLRFKVHLGPAR